VGRKKALGIPVLYFCGMMSVELGSIKKSNPINSASPLENCLPEGVFTDPDGRDGA
jgi:hypothetical protein